jgi:hypothetical protein
MPAAGLATTPPIAYTFDVPARNRFSGSDSKGALLVAPSGWQASRTLRLTRPIGAGKTAGCALNCDMVLVAIRRDFSRSEKH